jgi:hypothetical protein
VEISILNRRKSIHHEEPKGNEGKLKDKGGVSRYLWIDNLRALRDLRVNPDERPSNGLSEASMKIKRTQGFHPRRVKFDFHTNPNESPSNGLSGGKNENQTSPRIPPQTGEV